MAGMKVKAGALLPLGGDSFSGTLVPSADGRIFLASSETTEPVAPSPFSGLKLTIVEVACGAASP